MKATGLALAILFAAGLVSAHGSYERIDTTDFLNRAGVYDGRLVVVTGRVCAVSADRKSIQLFDPESKALIDVQLGQLKKSQRTALMVRPVLHVSVYGRAEVRNGKSIVQAHEVVVDQARAGAE